jgi:NTE family protein
MEAGYHNAALKMSEKESWQIVKKCHRHYALTKKVRAQIDRFKTDKLSTDFSQSNS